MLKNCTKLKIFCFCCERSRSICLVLFREESHFPVSDGCNPIIFLLETLEGRAPAVDLSEIDTSSDDTNYTFPTCTYYDAVTFFIFFHFLFANRNNLTFGLFKKNVPTAFELYKLEVEQISFNFLFCLENNLV